MYRATTLLIVSIYRLVCNHDGASLLVYIQKVLAVMGTHDLQQPSFNNGANVACAKPRPYERGQCDYSLAVRAQLRDLGKYCGPCKIWDKQIVCL